jgi:hypothetical protein
MAANPADGLATLVDAVPGLLAADWAVAAVVPADWAVRNGSAPRPALFDAARAVPDSYAQLDPSECQPAVTYASWRTPKSLRMPEVTPLRARALDGPDGTRYAVAPFGRAGLVLVTARTDGDVFPTAAFHISEVDRIAQLVRAAATILGDRLDLVTAGPADFPIMRSHG